MNSRKQETLALIGGLLACAAVANAGTIFQDNFDAGGPTIGGTRTLESGTGVTNTLQTSSPFTVGSGGYLNTAVDAATAGNALNIVTFTPTAQGNSWNAMQGSGVFGGNTLLTLNGGFDLFVRPSGQAAGATDYSWFRPVDFNFTEGMRLILTGTGNGQVQLNIQTRLSNGAGVAAFGATPLANTVNNELIGASLPAGVGFNNGSITHIGGTFSTDTNGQITMKLFAAGGTAAIDTTSIANQLASVSFYGDPTKVGSGFTAGAWTMSERKPVAGWPTPNLSVDYERVALYDGTVTGFPAVPEPASVGVLGLSALAMLRRNRKA